MRAVKLHYISERENLVTTVIKQHVEKAKENLVLGVSGGMTRLCLHAVLQLLFLLSFTIDASCVILEYHSHE